MKKLLALVLTMSLMLALLAPIAHGEESLKVWLPPFGTEDATDRAFWQEKLDAWGKENGVTINLEIVPWGNYEEKYLTGISSGNGPDVGYMYLEMIADYINMEALEPLDSYLTDADRENYLYLANGVLQGKQYMLPIIVGNPRILICNMDILKQAGLETTPQTWDDLVAYGLKIKQEVPDVTPFAAGWAQPSVGALNVLFSPYLWQAGGEYVDEDNNWIFNSPEGLKAAQFVYSLMNEHMIMPDACMAYNDSDVENLFLEGKAAMAIMGAGTSKELDSANLNWDFTTSLTDARRGTFVAADALVMTSTAKNKDLAFDCMRYITSGPVMAAFHKELSPFPPVAKDEEYGDNPRFESMYANDGDAFRTLPAVAGSSKVFDGLYKNLQQVMLGELEPQDALDQAVEYAATIG